MDSTDVIEIGNRATCSVVLIDDDANPSTAMPITTRMNQPKPERMGYQPALDGLRAVAVIAVLLYHAGFDWMRGGFFGVEVFFVVSGFLITALLRQERARTGRIDLRAFWIRRARRLLPALFVVLSATSIWVLLAGSDQQMSQVRRDGPWAIFYVGNWGQILGDEPYFAGDPSPLRHLWSLAVEEQWYVIWPLLFVGLVGVAKRRRVAGAVVSVMAVGVVAFTFWMSMRTSTLIGGPPQALDGVDRTNFLYLSTITRSSGLLLGAAAAFLWQPWTARAVGYRPRARSPDPLAFAAVAALAIAFVVAQLTERYVYQWLLGVVSMLSLVMVLAAVHPSAVRFRAAASWSPLVEVGKRSYGLYLWSWPVAVFVEATSGSWWRFAVSMVVTAPLVEVSYRFVEEPIRRGVLGKWWNRTTWPVVATGAATMAGVATLVVSFASVEQFDRLRGNDAATFDAAAAFDDADPTGVAENAASGEVSTVDGSGAEGSTGVGDAGSGGPDSTDGVGQDEATDVEVDVEAEVGPPATGATTGPAVTVSGTSPDVDDSVDEAATTTSTTSTTIVSVSEARLAIVGDSTANALAINDPDGIESVFPVIANGSRDGCGVYDFGRVVTEASFRNDFEICDGWQKTWNRAAAQADVTLVVLGAWDVFSIQDGDTTYEFDTPDGDRIFRFNLVSGINGMLDEGSNVALLEVPCMRPISTEGGGLPALPERGDDARVGHVNELLRLVADEYGPEVQFVEGPDEWCSDQAIATDTAYRWDGVHVYGVGAKLIYETIAGDVLAVASV